MRYAIRHTNGRFLNKDGDFVDTVQDARVYYRKGDCTNSLNVLTNTGWRRGPLAEYSKQDFDVVGVVIRTQSEWDLMEESLTKLDADAMIISKADYESLQRQAAWADALDSAGVDNWQGIDFAYEELRDFLKERGLEEET